jgi:hypothetical protein
VTKRKGAKKQGKRRESVIALPERLALTTLLDPTALLGGATPYAGSTGGLPSAPPTTGPTSDPNVTGAWNQIGSVAQDAQQAESGAIAENVESDGSTSTSSTNSSP